MTSEKPRGLKPRTPKLSVTLVTTLARDLYGLHMQSCQELDSFIDRNYHIKVDASHTRNQHMGQVCPHGYVLKILNSQDSKESDARTETALIQHVHGKSRGQGLCTPRVVPTIHGLHFAMCSLDLDTDSYKIVTDSGGKQHAVRLLEYMPGSALVTLPLSPRLAFQLGHCAATLDAILQDFDDSDYQVPGVDIDWRLVNLPSLRPLVDVIKDPAIRCITSDVIDTFETKLLKSEARETLKKGYIHADFNLHNILVSRTSHTNCSPSESRSSVTNTSDGAPVSSPSSTSSSSSPSSSDAWNISGVVDFGDVTKTFVIIEAGNAMCDAMLCCPVDLDPDVIAGHVLAGYLSQMALSPQEIEFLPLAICGRMAQALIATYQSLVLDPHNRYVSDSCAPLERELPRFWKIPVDVTLRLWQDVVQKHGVTFPSS